MTKLQQAHQELFERYKSKLEQEADFVSINGKSVPKESTREHLIHMCTTAIDNILNWPDDKASRWLGNVQGIMTVFGVITVDEEREVSRPLFHAAYEEQNKLIPETIDLKNNTY